MQARPTSPFALARTIGVGPSVGAQILGPRRRPIDCPFLLRVCPLSSSSAATHVPKREKKSWKMRTKKKKMCLPPLRLEQKKCPLASRFSSPLPTYISFLSGQSGRK